MLSKNEDQKTPGPGSQPPRQRVGRSSAKKLVGSRRLFVFAGNGHSRQLRGGRSRRAQRARWAKLKAEKKSGY